MKNKLFIISTAVCPESLKGLIWLLLFLPLGPGLLLAQAPNLPGSGNCLSYNGTSDYVNIPDNDNWNFGSNDFTVEAWINPQGGTDAGIYSQGDEYSSFAIVLSKFSGTVWKMVFSASAAGTIWDVSSGYVNTDMIDGMWYHIAVSRTGSTWKSYVNGINIASVTSSITIYDSNADPVIGLYQNPSNSDWRFFNGSIDEVRIWNNKGLTETEIRNTMCQKLPDNYGNGLVGYWRFDETSGTTAYDSSGNGNDGILK